MEVVTVIVTVGGLLHLLKSTIVIIDSVRNAPKTAIQVSDEIKSILAVNHDFEKALRDQNTKHTARIPVDWLVEVNKILTKMQEIAQALQKLAKRGRLTWALRMGTTKACLEQLSRYTQMLGAMEARLSWTNTQEIIIQNDQILSRVCRPNFLKRLRDKVSSRNLEKNEIPPPPYTK